MNSRNDIRQCGAMGRVVEIGIRETSAGNAILLEEMTHRFYNELAAMIGFINVTAKRSANGDVMETLSVIAAQIQEVANIQRALQMPDRDYQVDTSLFLGNLCRSISRAKLQYRNIHLILRNSQLELDAMRCWKLGMIVSELVTNAARHAFQAGGGQIGIDLSCRDGIVKSTVTDNGNAEPAARPGRGSRIVRALADELAGQIERVFGNSGTIVTVQFPLQNWEPQRRGPKT